MQVVLYRPQIPQNTGNIARSCAVTGSSLRLVPPLGFEITASELKRAGLDYWPLLDFGMIEPIDLWLEEHASSCIFFSSQASRLYTEVNYCSDSILLFGSETEGLPQNWRERWPEQFVRIPMRPVASARCLNLATSVGIGLYEALRHASFSGLC